jgi:hypothetical protein
MAVDRPLTSDEREILQGSSRYQSQAKWSLRNFADFWNVESDINTKVANVGYQRWAKNWIYANRIQANTSMLNDPNIPLEFVILSKGMLLWDSAVPVPGDTGEFIDTVIDYMIANNKFEEIAELYVAYKTETPVF